MPCRLIILLLIHTAFLFRTLSHTRVFPICISDANYSNILLDYALSILKWNFKNSISIILFFFVRVSLPQSTMITMGEFLRAIKIVKGNETWTKETLYFLKKLNKEQTFFFSSRGILDELLCFFKFHIWNASQFFYAF